MKHADVKAMIYAAYSRTVPDMRQTVLAACETAGGDDARRTEPTSGRATRRPVRAAIALAASLAIAAGALGYILHRTGGASVSIDANPGIVLRLDRGGRVLGTQAVNAEGEAVLGQLQLSRLPAAEAVSELVAALLDGGFVTDAQNSVLLTAEVKNAALLAELADSVLSVWSNAAVISQTLPSADEADAVAGQYGITRGKAAMALLLSAQYPDTPLRFFAGLTLGELSALAHIGSAEYDGIAASGAPAAEAFVGEDAARRIALEHSGHSPDGFFAAPAVSFTVVREQIIYAVSFSCAGALDGHAETDYLYELDALSGEVLRIRRTARGFSDGGYISADDARDIALRASGLALSDCSEITVRAVYGDGEIGTYSVRLVAGKLCCSCVVDAKSGETLSCETAPASDGWPIIESEARRVLGKPLGELTAEELAAITQLNISSGGTQPDGGYLDYSFLYRLPNLTSLHIAAQGLRDLTPFARLTRLQTLYISDSEAEIQSLEPLAGMTRLETLSLTLLRVSSLEPLSGLTKLKTLYLRYCGADSGFDISAVGKLTELETLRLDGCTGITALSPLAALQKLRVLIINDCPGADDWNFLAKLNGLSELNLQVRKHELADLSPLGALTSLVRLRLAAVYDGSAEEMVRDLSPLSGLTALRSLDAGDICATDLGFAATLGSIEDMRVGVLDPDFSPLTALTRLRALDINTRSVAELTPLGGMVSLNSFSLRGGSVRGAGALAALPALERLSITQTDLSDVSQLARLHALDELYLEYNRISDVSPLASLSGLKTLCLAGNPLTAAQTDALRAALAGCAVSSAAFAGDEGPVPSGG